MEIQTQHHNVGTQKFTKSDERYLSLLEEDGSLQHLIAIFRIQANIPSEGISIEPQSMGEALNQIAWSKLWNAVSSLLSVYQLPPSWRITMMSLLVFNIVTPPMHIDAIFQDVGNARVALEKEVHLVITEKMTRTDLRDYINAHYELDKLFDVLPEHKKINKPKIIEIGKQIVKWKNLGKTSGEILELLPYGKKDDNFDQAKIGVYYKRYMDAIQEYVIKDKHHRLLKAIEFTSS